MAKFTISLILILFTETIFACSCMGTSKEKYLEYADVVFLGTAQDVGSITTAEKIGPREYEGTKNETQFSVKEVFKGEQKSALKIYTQKDSAACGVSFKEGKSYFVFSYFTEEGLHPAPQPVGELATDSCTMTFELENDMESLNQEEADLLKFLRISKEKHDHAQKIDEYKQKPGAI